MLKRTAVVTLLVAALALGTTAFAGAGNGAGPNKSSSSISLVMLSSSTVSAAATSGPRWNDKVTFAVSTVATDRPYVLLNCYQNGVWVLASQAGFYADYPFGTSFTLASSAWMAGAADCTATLGTNSAGGTKFTKLASTSFHVDA
jgi:hypothetical protein